MSKSERNVPICIDLDGTLTYTDTLIEAYISWLKKSPWAAIKAWTDIRQGRAHFKRSVANHSTMDVTLLPYNQTFITWLKEQGRQGRTLIIATASDERIAQNVANHLGFIDEVIGSDGVRNISGHEKKELLVKRFGIKGFDYAGNATADLKVWPAAHHIILVNTSPKVRLQAENLGHVSKRFLQQSGRFDSKVLLHELRIHQWVKNLLVFVPLLTAHMFTNITLLSQAIFAFFAFSLTASSVYLFNDLIDLKSDRQHRTKQHRPLAAGTLPIGVAVYILASMPIAGILISLLLPWEFLGLLIVYVAINIGYSLLLKRIPFVDVLILAFLYVLRILSGSAATSIPTSIWLFIFAAFIFLSLALVKRTSELYNLEKQGRKQVTGRGYMIRHRRLLSTIGIGSSALSLIVLGFYTTSPAVTPLYSTPILLLLLIPIFAVWLTRIWRLTLHGLMDEDPVVFAAHDTMSYATAATALIIIFFAV